ncbi:MAG: hypothetical protein FJZ66_09980, partial [Bacteroidetes bacterium]|nr:hypothetical protein [Bacteroidota bacterium]
MSSEKRQKSLYLIVIGILIILFFLFTCDKKFNNDVDEFPIEGQTAEGFEDGTYCAEVDYYNPNTGKSSEYTLEVDVESNEVTTIYWGNGGWLDEDHFTPELLDEQGECSFSSDRGYEY